MASSFFQEALKNISSLDGLKRILEHYKEIGTLATVINVKDRHGDALVHFAARAQSVSTIQLLYDYGADMEAVNEHGRRPVHEAIDSLECVSFLVRTCHVDSNALKRGDWTPVMIAALKGRLDIIKELEQAGALFNLANKDGRTALHIAVQYGHLEVSEYLAAKCPACIVVETRSGRLPIQISAALCGMDETARDLTAILLAQAPVPLSVILSHRDKSGRNVLQDAVVAQNLTLLRTLCDYGADPNDGDSIGRNVIHYAAMLGHLDVLQMLQTLGQEKGIHLMWDTADNWDNWTPLMHAASNGHLNVVQFLVDKVGADASKFDKRGRSSKDLALAGNHDTIAEYLIKRSST